MNADHLKYCPVCAGESTVSALSKTDTRVVRGETYTVQSDYFECSQCQETFMPLEGDLGLRRAWEMYREKHGMVRPRELNDWRSSLEITQSELALILGWGVVTVSRYENGKLQEPAHDKALQSAMHNPDSLLELVLCAEGLAASTRARLVRRLEAECDRVGMERAFLRKAVPAPGEAIDISKLSHLVTMLCGKEGQYKTKLNKLLFYVDFKSYKEYGKTVSGLAYERLPRGPVPTAYDRLYLMLAQRQAVELQDEEAGPYTGVRIKALVESNRNCFSDQELALILAVKSLFEKASATEISDHSHQEAAWLESAMRSVISYGHARALSI